MINTVPLRLRNFKMMHCSLKCSDLDSHRGFEHDIAVRDDVFFPLFSCEFESAYKARQFRSTFDILQNRTLKQVVARLITAECAGGQKHFPSERELTGKVEFDECHEPYYNLLPLSCVKLSVLLRAYIPVQQIVDSVLIPYVGYNGMHCVFLNARIEYEDNGEDIGNAQCLEDGLCRKEIGDEDLEHIFEGTKCPVDLTSNTEWTVIGGPVIGETLYRLADPDDVEDESSSITRGLFGDCDSDSDSDWVFGH